jgi:hypothetical protein
MSNFYFDSFMTEPVEDSLLDRLTGQCAITRGVNETDAQLRARINGILQHQPGPDLFTLSLFEFLEKLGLKSTTMLLDTFMPVGHRWR